MIDSENWLSMASDVKGAAYEELLKEYAEDTKSGAGQYFTPRALINVMVKCLRPLPSKTICDPACGTGGFLLSAYDFLSNTDNYQLDREQKLFLKNKTFHGVELVQATYRLCLMNLFLHGISDINSNEIPIFRGDALINKPSESYDYVLANPPFGRKSSLTFTNEEGEEETESLTINRADFWTTTSNKQLNFVQHIYSILKVTGRAAIVVPDEVLSEGGAGDTVRKKLLEKTNLHTILRLPTGIFYKQGVKANVIFFDNKTPISGWQTKEVWVYDFRTNNHFTLKQNPMTESSLNDFVECYHAQNISERKETYSKDNPDGRWRKFSLEEIKANNYKLDLNWIEGEDLFKNYSLDDLFEIISKKATVISSSVKQIESLVDNKNIDIKSINTEYLIEYPLVDLVEKAKSKLLESIFVKNIWGLEMYDEEHTLDELLPYEQPGPYIVELTKYDDSYPTPVLTPGKTFVLGYTNEKNGIFKADKEHKVIIFDDFTTASRLIDFDFKVKSSAMKILKNGRPDLCSMDYLYYLLQSLNINHDTHKRYWISVFSPRKIRIHKPEDQKKIVKFVRGIFEMLDHLL